MHELFKSTDFNNLNINCTTSDVKYTLNVNGHVTVLRRSFKVSVSTMTRRSVVGVTHLPAIHRAGQLGLQIAVSGPPPLDATELKPSSVTNCITAIPVGFTPCSMNCSKRLHDDTLGKHFRKMSPERVDLGTNRRKIQEGGYSLGLTPHLLAPGSPARNQSRSGA